MKICGFGKYTGSRMHLITFRKHDYEVVIMNSNVSHLFPNNKQAMQKMARTLTLPKPHGFFTGKTEFFRRKLTKGSIILISKLGTGMVVDVEKDYLYVDFVNWKVIPIALYMLPELYMQRKFVVLRDCDGKKIEPAKPKTNKKI